MPLDANRIGNYASALCCSIKTYAAIMLISADQFGALATQASIEYMYGVIDQK